MNNVNYKIKTKLAGLSMRLCPGIGLLSASATALAVTETEVNNSFATADYANPGINNGVIFVRHGWCFKSFTH